MVTQQNIADHLGLDVETVRNVLTEAPGFLYDRELQDRVFRTARKMGYDFRKLKIGKRMEIRRLSIEDMIRQVEKHPEWGRDEILDCMRNSIGLVQRVQRKAFPQEFPTNKDGTPRTDDEPQDR